MEDIQQIAELHYSIEPIEADQIRKWFNSTDIHLLGALYSLIVEPAGFERVHPPISFEDFYDFLLRYWGRCIVENPASDWADSNYTAAHDAANFMRLSNDETRLTFTHKKRFKEWLERLYLEGSDSVRTCIVTGFLEHLLEIPGWRELFDSWRENPRLSRALSEATEWSNGRN